MAASPGSIRPRAPPLPQKRDMLTTLPYEVLSRIFILSRNSQFTLINIQCRAVTLDTRNRCRWLLQRNRQDAGRALRSALCWGFCGLAEVERLEMMWLRHQGLTTSQLEVYSDPSRQLSVGSPAAKRRRLALADSPPPAPDGPLPSATTHDSTTTPGLHPALREFYATCRLSRALFQVTDLSDTALAFVLTMLDRGVSAGQPNGFPLVKSSQINNVAMVRILLNHGADPNCKGGMALKLAAGKGHYDVVRLLLKQGGVPGNEALRFAIANGHFRVAKLLMKHGAVPDMETLRIINRNQP
ncbi:hypothetical protein IWQ60_004740 [Tieghemiomyces parasiticus]|uniref:Uncharacterized protein n=1 Tax=Tieghemiomyces parasiticus TaxID=78921 RepID=A0A9W8DTM2_9FUNG|nr:hypothetical protein IWQ60_004740 [Tieghemiomyces parasiticus]